MCILSLACFKDENIESTKSNFYSLIENLKKIFYYIRLNARSTYLNKDLMCYAVYIQIVS